MWFLAKYPNVSELQIPHNLFLRITWDHMCTWRCFECSRTVPPSSPWAAFSVSSPCFLTSLRCRSKREEILGTVFISVLLEPDVFREQFSVGKSHCFSWNETMWGLRVPSLILLVYHTAAESPQVSSSPPRQSSGCICGVSRERALRRQKYI